MWACCETLGTLEVVFGKNCPDLNLMTNISEGRAAPKSSSVTGGATLASDSNRFDKDIKLYKIL